jgi:hypothetical protein
MPLKSDPRSLPRRNHYQEGPGFLFLATQGGRPPESVAPGTSAGIIRRRAAALRRWREGEPVAGLCAELGVQPGHPLSVAQPFRGGGRRGTGGRGPSAWSVAQKASIFPFVQGVSI